MFTAIIRPFAYLTIRHPSHLPLWVNWGLPACVSVLMVGGVWLAGMQVDVFGSNGVVSRLLGFLQSLPGFYIAALAAIATFNNPEMLKVMPGTPPTMSIEYNGRMAKVPLTRRRFLSSMFAFLTASSVVLTLVSIASLSMADQLKAILPALSHGAMKAVFSLVFFTLVGQMISVTMWGLCYLGERIHTPD